MLDSEIRFSFTTHLSREGIARAWSDGENLNATLKLSSFSECENTDREFDHALLMGETPYTPHPLYGEPSTGSAAHMWLIKYWLSECLERHVHCRKQSMKFMPKRLIKIDYPDLSLHLTGSEDAASQYCALGHR